MFYRCMRVTIRKKNLELTGPLREYIERKIVQPVEKRLRQMDHDSPILDIEVARTTHHHHKGLVYAVSVSLTLKDTLIRAEAADMDIHAACDALEDELTREIVAYKGKAQSLLKRGARQAKKDLHLAPEARLFRKGRIRNEGN